ncbi:ribosome hibernation promoting factor [Shewanella sp. YIC-542]|uniref:ribosome hibernation promoting factor n=1 Tax=Shewanella mytili TaxID=3377111 RepID=UPI00398EA3DD
MQINLAGHHIEITDSLKSYVEGKFAKLERHFEQINNVRVVLTVEKDTQRVEAKLNLNGGEVHGTAEHSDMYAAIDALIDKLDRQVIKYKEKLTKYS